MNKRSWVFALVGGLLLVGVAVAQQYPMVDAVADKVVNKYRNASCEQLWEKKGAAPSEREQEALQMLRDDPQLRAVFIKKIADPVLNKMFECGMFP